MKGSRFIESMQICIKISEPVLRVATLRLSALVWVSRLSSKPCPQWVMYQHGALENTADGVIYWRSFAACHLANVCPYSTWLKSIIKLPFEAYPLIHLQKKYKLQNSKLLT